MSDDYSNLSVCTRHFTLVGNYDGKEHLCGCASVDDGWRDREWKGYDIAALVDLCHLCVRDVMRSGARWSWYACETCRTVNNQIANAILGDTHPRNQILPLGRHSLMDGVALGLDPTPGEETVARFAESLRDLFGFVDRLLDWRREEGRRLAAASGFRGDEFVPPPGGMVGRKPGIDRCVG